MENSEIEPPCDKTSQWRLLLGNNHQYTLYDGIGLYPAQIEIVITWNPNVAEQVRSSFKTSTVVPSIIVTWSNDVEIR